MNPEIALSEAHKSFLHEVRETTSMLKYALAGIEVYRQNCSSGLRVSIPPPKPCFCLSSELSGVDYHHFLRSTGSAAQLVYKGWVDHVYGLWENTYRNDSHTVLKDLADDAIRPEADVLGDFRHIRNDLVHGGVATPSRSGSCDVLKWFSAGEKIVLNFNHVLDFLNQIGAFGSRVSLALLNEGKTQAHVWHLLGGEATLRAWSPDPILVSVRSGEGPAPGTLGVSVVFENGVFGQIPLTFSEQSIDHGKSTDKHYQVEISADGKSLIIDKGKYIVPAPQLYDNCLTGYFHPELGEKGPGMPSPRFRFRRGGA